MDDLSDRKSAVLEVLDEQIEKLERKLVKVQPLLNELNQLRQTKRVLLSENSTTGGAGTSGRSRLTQEEVITFLKANGVATPAQIAEGTGAPAATVRSHLHRHKDTTYTMDDGMWGLVDA